MVKIRNFASVASFISGQWRRQITTRAEWQPRPDLGVLSSASKPFWVSSRNHIGVAKPGSNVPIAKCPEAAHEKICADLAYDLGLPVPPVVLWDRGPVKGWEQQYTAISVVPFPNAWPWGEVQNDKDMGPRVKSMMPEVASAMSAFDTWVDNRDHNNHPGNLLVSLIEDKPPKLHIAYIDYARALAYGWKNREWCKSNVTTIYAPDINTDKGAMDWAINKISEADEEAIVKVVQRIPEPYLQAQQRDIIIQGLLDRRARIREIMATNYQEVA